MSQNRDRQFQTAIAQLREKRRKQMTELRAGGMTLEEIGRRFGISKQAVSQILRGGGHQ